ncbi:tryparedoxin, putative [Bodo saltans]|uniref:Nucleoredoxin n=1 Tax=Bodo saltans TaxID=75058 RepID=B6DTG2_BODSA|nr:nucleoredoxin [Bodo saltans]CUG90311.1 tryparedoxin, putative [Bodo saltans]|eukprot:CUG90311.1 tryparedoxin, putative [Bodo saltans]
MSSSTEEITAVPTVAPAETTPESTVTAPVAGASAPKTPLQKLLRGLDMLLVKGSESIPASSIAPPVHKNVLFYFSAQWCPPCKRFTTRLAQLYKELRDRGRTDFEVIFVSCDSSAGEFSEYSKEMPFPAIPFSKKKERDSLLRKFKVQSLPTLVVIDAVDGTVINKSAVQDAREEHALEKFPWKSRTLLDILEDLVVTAKDGSRVTAEKLKTLSCFSIYFAGQWSPPCRAFTPQLMSIYGQLKEFDDERRNTEIIFISCDRTLEAYEEFCYDMPWAAAGFQHPMIKELTKLLDLHTAPALVTCKPDGTVLNKNARFDASDDLSGERYPWSPDPLPPATELHPSEQVVAALNETCCFTLHLNGSGNAQTQLTEFKAAATEFGPAHNAASGSAEDSVKVNFFVTPENDADLLQRLVAVVAAQLPPAGKAFVLCTSILGEKTKEVFAGDITKQSIIGVATRFVKKVKDGAAPQDD